MTNNTTYYWRIDEVNAGGTTTGTIWSFTTIVGAPAAASSPSPANSATNVAVNADLSWSAGAGATSHDVYFGTSSPGTSQGNQTATTFDTGTMSNNTTYYWRIDEVNVGGTTTGSVWSFTTIVAAPGAASSPSPANSATGVSITADLSWSAGSGATSRDVYFGTSSPGASQGNQTATTFDR
jgi:P pilus assembly chaperone PapD